MPFPTRKKPIVKDYSKKNLIDTTEDKFANSPGLKHWADIQNLKIAAASYSQAGSISELEKQIAAKSALAKTARTSLVEAEHQLKDLGQINVSNRSCTVSSFVTNQNVHSSLSYNPTACPSMAW